MALYEIPDAVVDLLECERRCAFSFQNVVECAGGWPTVSGLVCPHCGSTDPDSKCGKGLNPDGSSGPGETYFEIGELKDFKLKDDDMATPRNLADPLPKLKKGTTRMAMEYTPTEARTRLVVIEAVFPLDESEYAEAVSKALEELRCFGGAAIVESKAIVQSFDDACKILNSRERD